MGKNQSIPPHFQYIVSFWRSPYLIMVYFVLLILLIEKRQKKNANILAFSFLIWGGIMGNMGRFDGLIWGGIMGKWGGLMG